VLADDERGGDIGQAFRNVEFHRLRLAALQVQRGDLLHATAGAEGAEVEVIAEHAGAEAALAVAGIVLPVELAGLEVEAHDAAAGVGADDFLFAALQLMHHGRGEGVEAVGHVVLPHLLAVSGVEADDAALPLTLLGCGGEVLAVLLHIELAAHDHDAIDHEGGDAGAVLVDVAGHLVIAPQELAAVVEGERLDVGPLLQLM
jgi:hypothetical protein